MTPDEFQTILAERQPGFSPGSIVGIGAGEFCHAFLVDDLDVYRVAQHGEAGRALQREACVLGRIAGSVELSIPVPIEVNVEARPAYVSHRLVEGDQLTRERYEALPSTRRREAATAVGTLLRQLHGIDRSIVEGCGLEVIDAATSRDRVASLAPTTLTQLGEPSRTFVAQVLEQPALTTPEPVLLHGDLSPEHVLADADGTVTGIIDFGDVAVGDPAWDFVYLYADYGIEFLEVAALAYAPASPANFAERLFNLYALDLIEWTLEALDEDDDDPVDTVRELDKLAAHHHDRLAELRDALRVEDHLDQAHRTKVDPTG